MGRSQIKSARISFIVFGIFVFFSAGTAFAADCRKGFLQSTNQYALASWAMIPPDAKGPKIQELEQYIEKTCNESECPSFCTNEKSKVPKDLLDLQKRCREKEAAACGKFYSEMGLKNPPNPFESCVYLGGRACDFCDLLGGNFCKPGLRFGEPIHDTPSALIHKIACRAGYAEACDGFKVLAENDAKRQQENCDSRRDSLSCSYVIATHVRAGRVDAALAKTMSFCSGGHLENCQALYNAGIDASEGDARVTYQKAINDRLSSECTSIKNRVACYVLADGISKVDPEKSLTMKRELCLSSQSGSSTLEHSACYVTFEKSIKDKKWPDAEKAANVLCSYYLNAAPNKNSALCDQTRAQLNEAKGVVSKNNPSASKTKDQLQPVKPAGKSSSSKKSKTVIKESVRKP